MLDRRVFLAGSLASLSLQAAPLRGAEEPESIDVNRRLQEIMDLLRNSPQISSITPHLVENASVGLCQWEWSHFRPDVPAEYLPFLVQANEELLQAMRRVQQKPELGLDALMYEGIVEGRVDEMMAHFGDMHRHVLTQKFTHSNPFLLADVSPTAQQIEAAMLQPEQNTEPISILVNPHDAPRQHMDFSPLTLLGPAYFLHAQDGVKILPAEDPLLATKAEEAEQHGSAEEYQQWVLDKRNEHFVSVARTARRPLVHFLVGYGHDLQTEIQRSNATNMAQISSIVISVQGVEVCRKIDKQAEDQEK